MYINTERNILNLRIVKHPLIKKITVMLFGHGLWATASWIFNYILYPSALIYFGYVLGGAIMTALSCMICAGVLIHYQHSKVDWVGSGMIDALRTADTTKRGWFVRTLAWFVKKGDFFMFVLLSIFQDPFITAAYFTRGAFKGITKKIWVIFGLSCILSNLYWTVRMSFIIAILKGIYSLFR